MKDMIESRQNGKIKFARALRDKKARRETGLTLVEGRREISMAIRNNVELTSLFYCPEKLRGPDDTLLLEQTAEKPGVKIYPCALSAYSALAYRESTEPFVAVATPRTQRLQDIVLTENPLILVAETVEKPGNLGGILRTADAVGTDAVIVCDKAVDINSPNVIRASVGTVFSMQIAESDMETTTAFLNANNIHMFAAMPDAQLDYTDADMSGPSAIFVGSEHHGLQQKSILPHTIKIKIPMTGHADSLNVSVSAALILFEARRQRKNGRKP